MLVTQNKMMVCRLCYTLEIHSTKNLQAQMTASMVAFSCPTEAIVNKCHQLLIMNGGANEGDQDRVRITRSDGYYAYGRDLDGNKLLFYFDAEGSNK